MTSHLAWRVVSRTYRDSVALMSVAAGLEKQPGVIRAGAVMGTGANVKILTEAGMWPAEARVAPDDLLVVVRADDPGVAASAIDEAFETLITGQPQLGGREIARPQTLAQAWAAAPDTNLVAISTPGEYAAIVGEQALRAGRHVFCFSDNVSLADEIRLKELAIHSGLLFMGPDCGTALLDSTPLGFVNTVRRGPVGMIAASGTGAQEITCLLDRAGLGIAQIIGVGGRDLSSEVAARMTRSAVKMLSAQEDIEIIVLVSKPPAPEVAEDLVNLLATLSQPVVACFLGAPTDERAGVRICGTLESAAATALELAGKDSSFLTEPALGLENAPKSPPPAGRIAGLFTGGTLASEAAIILAHSGVPASQTRLLDLGDDQYTRGRPHPMIEPTLRAQMVVDVSSDPTVKVLLFDVVLGYGSHESPAKPLADAIIRAKQQNVGREFVAIGSVCGTDGDHQGRLGQIQLLIDAGCIVAPTNAAAARLAATIVRRNNDR